MGVIHSNTLNESVLLTVTSGYDRLPRRPGINTMQKKINELLKSESELIALLDEAASALFQCDDDNAQNTHSKIRRYLRIRTLKKRSII